MSSLKSELLFEMAADVDTAGGIEVGSTPQGLRRIFPVTGGQFEGPRLQGVVLPGGGDWATWRQDGVGVLDVRAALRTDDGHVIYTYYRGVIIAEPGDLERVARGEEVDPATYYFRTTPIFETASEKYGWLNRIIAVGIGRFTATGVAYRVYSIL